MKTLIGQALLALALAIAAAACGDSGHLKLSDAGMPPPPDAPAMQETLTQYVTDLVQNQTANNTGARPYTEFQSLPDPDGSNGSAYAPLFP